MKIKNVSVVFDGFQALTDVNVKVKRNSIHFFIGPNGAGKTTLLDIICAKTKPTGGNVSFYPMHGEAFCEEVRKLLEDERKNCQGGITRLTEGDYAVRLFGWRGQVLEELSDKILRLLRKNPV